MRDDREVQNHHSTLERKNQAGQRNRPHLHACMKRKVIPVLLVFVMLLGMLPTVAFATNATEPNKDDNGVYQIGTAAELLWFQQQVSAGQTSINAVLTANVDLSSVCGETLGSWTAIPTYAGTFDGRGYTISNLYISGATNAKQGLFAELSETGVVQNLGITQSKVLMSTSNKKNNANAAILVGYSTGSIINCYVTNSFVLTNAQGMGKGAAICGNQNGGKIFNCYSVGNTITENQNKQHIGGICGYSKATIENCYVVNTILNSTASNVKSICGSNSGATITNCYYLSTGKEDDKATSKEDSWFKSDDAITALGTTYFAKDTESKNSGYPILTFASASEGTNKESLTSALASLNLPTTGYYTENDRWNGTSTSENGFWADLQALVKPAQDVLEDDDATRTASP